MTIKRLFDWLIPITFIASLLFLSYAVWSHMSNQCSIERFYEIGEWGGCQPGGVRTRVVRELENIQCISKRKPDRPVDKENCVFIPDCTEEDYVLGAWGTCDGTEQKRTVALKEGASCNEIVKPSSMRECSTEGKTLILQDYTTQIDTSTKSGNSYEPSYRNVQIRSTGKITSLKLHLSATTTVLGGKLIQVPEYYYFMFAIDDNVARVLGTSRIDPSRLNLDGEGIFKGTQMPIEHSFNLQDAILAKASNERSIGNLGYIPKNYVDVLNKNSGKTLNVTLFLADGRSMIEEDIKKRIFGTITFAYLEYECANSPCRIERIPALNP